MANREGERTMTMVPLTLGGLEDEDGKTADMIFVEALQEIEEHIQRFRASHYQNLPEKPYTVTLKIEVAATQREQREITWEFRDVKAPKLSGSHIQYGVSQDGVLMTTAMQTKMEFNIPDYDHKESPHEEV